MEFQNYSIWMSDTTIMRELYSIIKEVVADIVIQSNDSITICCFF